MHDAPPAPRQHRWRGFTAGVAAGALFALGLYLLADYLQPHSGLILISVMLIPAAAAAVAVRVAGIRGDGWLGMAGAVVTALLIGSAFIFREGAICLAMAAPVFYPLGMIGARVAASGGGKRRGSTTMVVLAPLLLMPLEQQGAYPLMDAAVVTQIEIAAPIETVWRHALEIRDIAPEEQSWTITHAVLRVPRPTDARIMQRGNEVARAATWAGGVQFYEVIEEQREHQSVRWRFEIPEAAANQLLDEHLRLDEGYLQMQRGGYALEAISPTRTRLTLTTHYSARTPFNLYARAWGALLLGDIHGNALNIVRARAERAAQREH